MQEEGGEREEEGEEKEEEESVEEILRTQTCGMIE
jgi:hypothetical protein